jgi:capsid protein
MDWLDESTDAMNFGYDAVEDSGRRKSPKKTISSEDKHLKSTARKSLVATTRDMRRNFIVTRWAIHKHIDFVVDHKFKADTGNKDFDKTLEEFFQFASRAENFDKSGRHSLRKFMRLAESSRIVDGDFFAIRLRGGYLQAIEGDRVRNPKTVNRISVMGLDGEPDWTEGVKTNKYGRPSIYAIHTRSESGGGFEYEGSVGARKVIPLGFFDRFDQVRGISPLSAAVNTLKDLYESYDYALAKAKVAQLMTLKITREADWGLGQDEDDDSTANSREVTFDKGPQILDLDSGEDADFLSTGTPGEETAAFWQEMTGLVLKSLNIPYSFFQENHTNFFGSRSALILYLRAVEQWREDITNFMNDWLCWRLKVGQLKGEINLPADFDCDPKNWKWIPTGIQYWDPAKEVKADTAALEAGLTTRSQIRAERYGDSWDDDVYPIMQAEFEKMKAVTPEPIQQQGNQNEPTKQIPKKPEKPKQPK